MDYQTLSIGLVCMATVLIPILYIWNKQKKEKQRLLQEFISVAMQHHLNITEFDLWDPCYAIGIDSNKNKLLYTQMGEGKDKVVLCDLSEIKQCRVNNLSMEANGNKIIEHIELALVHPHSGQREQTLEFYNKEVSLVLNNELLLAEKWKNILSTRLTASATERTVISEKVTKRQKMVQKGIIK